MNKKLSALLTTAIVTGLLASQTVRAEDTATQKAGDQPAVEKNKCKGHADKEDKNSCKGQKAKKKKKKGEKNSCKNGCGESKDKKDSKETTEEKK